jgi:uncharacterized protein (TIGR03086 family)
VDALDQSRRAMAEFDHRVMVFTEERWHAGTPCDEWDARDLVNHVVVEQLWAPHLLAGETLEDVGDRYDGDQLGDDPVGTWLDAAAEARDAFTAEGALDGTVATSMGPMPAREYLAQMTLDLAIHAWDLARAIAQDEELDPELVEELYRACAPIQAELTASGAFGTPVEVPESADAQTRLLGLLGRDATRS